MIDQRKKKAGINQPIICKKCGKRVGFIKIRTLFRVRVWFWIFVLATVTQIISEIIGRIVLGG